MKVTHRQKWPRFYQSHAFCSLSPEGVVRYVYITRLSQLHFKVILTCYITVHLHLHTWSFYVNAHTTKLHVIMLNGVQARIQKFFKRGGGHFKEKRLLINVSKRVYIKTRQTCNSFSLLPFQEDCLLFFFALFYYFLLFLKFEKGGGVATPVPPLDPPMGV